MPTKEESRIYRERLERLRREMPTFYASAASSTGSAHGTVTLSSVSGTRTRSNRDSRDFSQHSRPAPAGSEYSVSVGTMLAKGVLQVLPEEPSSRSSSGESVVLSETNSTGTTRITRTKESRRTAFSELQNQEQFRHIADWMDHFQGIPEPENYIPGNEPSVPVEDILDEFSELMEQKENIPPVTRTTRNLSNIAPASQTKTFDIEQKEMIIPALRNSRTRYPPHTASASQPKTADVIEQKKPIVSAMGKFRAQKGLDTALASQTKTADTIEQRDNVVSAPRNPRNPGHISSASQFQTANILEKKDNIAPLPQHTQDTRQASHTARTNRLMRDQSSEDNVFKAPVYPQIRQNTSTATHGAEKPQEKIMHPIKNLRQRGYISHASCTKNGEVRSLAEMQARVVDEADATPLHNELPQEDNDTIETDDTFDVSKNSRPARPRQPITNAQAPPKMKNFVPAAPVVKVVPPAPAHPSKIFTPDSPTENFAPSATTDSIQRAPAYATRKSTPASATNTIPYTQPLPTKTFTPAPSTKIVPPVQDLSGHYKRMKGSKPTPYSKLNITEDMIESTTQLLASGTKLDTCQQSAQNKPKNNIDLLLVPKQRRGHQGTASDAQMDAPNPTFSIPRGYTEVSPSKCVPPVHTTGGQVYRGDPSSMPVNGIENPNGEQTIYEGIRTYSGQFQELSDDYCDMEAQVSDLAVANEVLSEEQSAFQSLQRELEELKAQRAAEADEFGAQRAADAEKFDALRRHFEELNFQRAAEVEEHEAQRAAAAEKYATLKRNFEALKAQRAVELEDAAAEAEECEALRTELEQLNTQRAAELEQREVLKKKVSACKERILQDRVLITTYTRQIEEYQQRMQVPPVPKVNTTVPSAPNVNAAASKQRSGTIKNGNASNRAPEFETINNTHASNSRERSNTTKKTMRVERPTQQFSEPAQQKPGVELAIAIQEAADDLEVLQKKRTALTKLADSRRRQKTLQHEVKKIKEIKIELDLLNAEIEKRTLNLARLYGILDEQVALGQDMTQEFVDITVNSIRLEEDNSFLLDMKKHGFGWDYEF